MKTLSKAETAKVLNTLKSNYRKSYSGMKTDELKNLFEIWEEGLKKVDATYIFQALDWYTYEYTGDFAPTIGQFLAKANEYRAEYERKHPVIRNAWETRIDG